MRTMMQWVSDVMQGMSLRAGYSHCETETSTSYQGKGRWNTCGATGFNGGVAPYRHNLRLVLGYAS